MTPLNMKIGQFNSCSCPFSAATKFIAAGQLEGKLMIFIFVACLKKDFRLMETCKNEYILKSTWHIF